MFRFRCPLSNAAPLVALAGLALATACEAPAVPSFGRSGDELNEDDDGSAKKPKGKQTSAAAAGDDDDDDSPGGGGGGGGDCFARCASGNKKAMSIQRANQQCMDACKDDMECFAECGTQLTETCNNDSASCDIVDQCNGKCAGKKKGGGDESPEGPPEEPADTGGDEEI